MFYKMYIKLLKYGKIHQNNLLVCVYKNDIKWHNFNINFFNLYHLSVGDIFSIVIPYQLLSVKFCKILLDYVFTVCWKYVVVIMFFCFNARLQSCKNKKNITEGQHVGICFGSHNVCSNYFYFVRGPSERWNINKTKWHLSELEFIADTCWLTTDFRRCFVVLSRSVKIKWENTKDKLIWTCVFNFFQFITLSMSKYNILYNAYNICLS